MDKVEARLHLVEGQVRGIARMIAEDQPCLDILTQVHACRSALKAFAIRIVADELSRIVARAATADASRADLDRLERSVAELARS
jgi:DNA-binding FrmR family transcriptional regulator